MGTDGGNARMASSPSVRTRANRFKVQSGSVAVNPVASAQPNPDPSATIEGRGLRSLTALASGYSSAVSVPVRMSAPAHTRSRLTQARRSTPTPSRS